MTLESLDFQLLMKDIKDIETKYTFKQKFPFKKASNGPES